MSHEERVCNVRSKARHVAFIWYCRKGYVPTELIAVIEGIDRIDCLLKESTHWRDQPRVPAGNPDGGQWVGEGSGDAPRDSAGLRKAPDQAADKRAQAIYGETSGLVPRLTDPKGNPYRSSN